MTEFELFLEIFPLILTKAADAAGGEAEDNAGEDSRMYFARIIGEHAAKYDCTFNEATELFAHGFVSGVAFHSNSIQNVIRRQTAAMKEAAKKS